MTTQRVWAVDHRFGTALVRAPTSQQAIDLLRAKLGDDGGPFKVQRDQTQAVLYARTNGAVVIEPDPTPRYDRRRGRVYHETRRRR